MKNINLPNVLALLSIVVTVLIWYVDKNSYDLQFKTISQVALQPSSVETLKDLKITINNKPLNKPVITVFEIANTGSKPILATDIEGPIEVATQKTTSIIEYQIISTNPEKIDVHASLESGIVKIQPLLLNPQDKISLSILTENDSPKFSIKARVSNIHKPSIVSIEETEENTTTAVIVLFIMIAISLLVASSIFNKIPIQEGSVGTFGRLKSFFSGLLFFIGFLLSGVALKAVYNTGLFKIIGFAVGVWIFSEVIAKILVYCMYAIDLSIKSEKAEKNKGASIKN